ncbi:non-hydrolyzing UDP-N-acetylglucosamine 2-epimerase [Terribacillus sp. DMT04]|uniref:non-hydrolyzing UDP-N-acetylglucosamine 2-epimerase n=1 Tax=Terribacillus sp. DMT04 TaxID=2850441 RepID=UPI001C2BA8A4|nr:UDP-N-acetylglucosamine 2-epimerase (non-hydrolyzing) [Terribacillus sp. DMT04]QXE00860.1 UDP-N-acetylglucosamine 2-epimerase (non-hydrolyzing) [Terribacillus sp. DMT04]
MKLAFILGTRPEGIKLAPIISKLKQERDFSSLVIHTGQHTNLLDDVLNIFSIQPDYQLSLMKPNQSAEQVIAAAIPVIADILKAEKPDMVAVVGDTATTFAAAFAAFHIQIPVMHIEAGLRTYDHYTPFPEEMYRQLVTRIAAVHFAPTEQNKQNLLQEKIDASNIHVVGNPVIDALFYIQNYAPSSMSNLEHMINAERKLILLTTHRRENMKSMQYIYEAINQMLNYYDDVEVIFPVHPNPNVRKQVHSFLHAHNRLHIIDPIDYVSFTHLYSHAYLVITDSGGIQEEAPAFDVPVVVTRSSTERTEGVKAGTLILAGTEKQTIKKAIDTLLTDASYYQRTAAAANPYGDGRTSERIVKWLKKYKTTL